MRVAVVLSAVGAAGAVQAGMLVALAEGGVRPTAFVGSSAGAVNALGMAAGGGDEAAAAGLAEMWASASDLLAVSPAGALAGLLGGRGHVLAPGPLRTRLARHVGLQRLEDAPVPVHLLAADARSGEPLVLSHGPAVDAVLASAALPGLLPAVRWDGAALIDGSLAAAGPLSYALGLRADRVIVLAGPDGDPARDGGVAATAVRTLSMLARRQLAHDIAPAPHVTVVCPPSGDPADFSDLRGSVEYGVAAGRRLFSPRPGSPPTPAAGWPACRDGARRGARARR
jgi:NTE family protein